LAAICGRDESKTRGFLKSVVRAAVDFIAKLGSFIAASTLVEAASHGASQAGPQIGLAWRAFLAR